MVLLSFASLVRLSRRFTAFRNMSHEMKYLNQEEATRVDQELFNDCGFSVDQLMEMAGLSVASAVAKQYPQTDPSIQKVLICCGPGNNGGDGLVSARHLKLFGYDPVVVYPKRDKSELFQRLVRQCESYEIEVQENLPPDFNSSYGLIIDAIFGFSYQPPLRPQFYDILSKISKSGVRIISVDIPSGWIVDEGPPVDDRTPRIDADCLISLTAPKLCAKKFKGSAHYLGGRFIPDSMEKKYGLNLPKFPGTESCLLIQP